MTVYELSSPIPCSADELFAYHARRGALTRLSPPFEKSRNAHEVEALVDGAVATVELDTPIGWRNWRAVHSDVQPGRGFVDTQAEGPFKKWKHEHIFTPIDATSCTLTDRITYEPPMGGGAIVARRLARVFPWRHTTTARDIELMRALPSKPLTVAITGASGLVGRELASLLRVAGHNVIALVRGKTWDVSSGAVRLPVDTALDAVVHLAGEPIAEGRLDEAHRRSVRASRVEVTSSLARKLSAPVFVSASAVGYYGDRGDEVLDETKAKGTGSFLADLCADWERAAHEARGRVATLRIGVVLSPAGGALAQMLPPFRAGLGATLGAGSQWMPLVSIDDVAAALFRAVVDTRVSGAVNAVGPDPLTNHDFTKLLGRVLSRPAIARVPKVAASVLFGKGVAEEALYVSQRAVPAKLQSLGHTFRHATTEQALRHVLGH